MPVRSVRGSRPGHPLRTTSTRPKLSVKPAIGFQAALGAASIPSVSQPFQGKSFSFTVRMNIGELKPVTEFVGDVFDAGGERGAEVFALYGVARDACATIVGEHRNKRALQIDAFHGILIGGRFETP